MPNCLINRVITQAIQSNMGPFCGPISNAVNLSACSYMTFCNESRHKHNAACKLVLVRSSDVKVAEDKYKPSAGRTDHVAAHIPAQVVSSTLQRAHNTCPCGASACHAHWRRLQKWIAVQKLKRLKRLMSSYLLWFCLGINKLLAKLFYTANILTVTKIAGLAKSLIGAEKLTINQYLYFTKNQRAA